MSEEKPFVKGDILKRFARVLVVTCIMLASLAAFALPASASTTEPADTTITVPIPGTPCAYVITFKFGTTSTPPVDASGEIVCSG